MRGAEKIVKRRKPWQPGGDPNLCLDNLSVGQWVDGTVVRLLGYGAWVDVGSEVDGFVHVRALRDEFTHHPADIITPGEQIKVCVKHLDYNPQLGVSAAEMKALAEAIKVSNGDKDAETSSLLSPSEIKETIRRAKAAGEETSLALSCLPVKPLGSIPERAHGRAVLLFDDENFEEGSQVWGEVTRVTYFGAFVDVGAEAEAFLHVSDYPERMIGQSAPDCFSRGQRLLAYVKELDLEANRLKLTKFRPKELPRVPL